MNSSKVIILFMALYWNTWEKALSQEIGPYTYLRKLSYHLRGKSPSAEEYIQLRQSLIDKAEEKFFKDRIQEYLRSNEHILKMDYRLSQVFMLENSPILDPTFLPENDIRRQFQRHYYNSLNSLFREIAEKNLSWDTLLIGKDYQTYGNGRLFANEMDIILMQDDFGFYGAIAPEKLPSSSMGVVRKQFTLKDHEHKMALDKIRLEFASDDPRVAGALTTKRFMLRFVNNSVNKNRRRAAAIFRIFLCDPITVGLKKGQEIQDKLLHMAFPKDRLGHGFSEEGSNGDVHGQDQSCRTCHQKLDPLGMTFANSSAVLSPIPSAGALNFKRTDGTFVNFPVKGIGELAKVITQQEEYLNCQMRLFWDWFIGTDVELDQKGLKQLKSKFEEVERKTNDFIAYLVTRPEFKAFQQSSLTEPLILNAKRIFRNCTSCHSGIKEKVPAFDSWPIQNELGDMDYWISRISTRLDLPHNGAKADMPPKWEGPMLSSIEIKNLKDWIERMAPDEKGNPQIKGHQSHEQK